jgi:hypothetical protein
MDDLKAIIDGNLLIDWRLAPLNDPGFLATIELHSVAQSRALPLLEAYQRILRVLPAGEETRAKGLLDAGLHSAIQIAGMPQQHFERRWAALFPGEEALGVRVYRAALARRSELVHRHVDEIQRNEPHYRAARFK